MLVKIKKLVPEAVIPKYSKPGDAGLDLVAVSKSFDEFGNVVYGIGLAFEIPEGYYLDIRPRSSNTKMDLVMLNSPATVDSGYRGEVTIKYRYSLGLGEKKIYEVGDRVAQGIILAYPTIEFEEAEELSETERGHGSYGHTGK